MSNINIIPGLLAIIFGVGCSMTPNENDVKIKNQSDEAVEADSCGAGALKHLVGQSYNTVKDLPKHRWMRPGYKYTQQYKPSRLNIVTDENGIIKSVRCG